MPPSEKRRWIDLVFEEIRLTPAGRSRKVVFRDRLELKFRGAYQPPKDELGALLDELDREVRRTQRPRVRTDAAVEQLIFQLHHDGTTTGGIKRELEHRSIPSPMGRPTWSTNSIARVLERMHTDRGLTYVRTAPDTSKLPWETREMIAGLYERIGVYGKVARELNALSVTRPDGRAWTGEGVRQTIVAHLKKQEKRGGRPRHLSEELRQIIWKNHRIDNQSLGDIAKWLEAAGIRTASGSSVWDRSTILNIVRAVDDDRAADAPRASLAA